MLGLFFATALVSQQGGNRNSPTDPKRSHHVFSEFVNPQKSGWKVFRRQNSSCEGILLVPWSTWQLSPQSIRSSSLMPWYHWPPFSPMQPSSLLDSRYPKIQKFRGFKKTDGHLKVTNQMKVLDTINHQWKQIQNGCILLITLNVKLLGPFQLVFSWENWIIYKVYINIHIHTFIITSKSMNVSHSKLKPQKHTHTHTRKLKIGPGGKGNSSTQTIN